MSWLSSIAGAIFGGGKKSSNTATAKADNYTTVNVESSPNVFNQIDLSSLAAAQRETGQQLSQALVASSAIQARSTRAILDTVKDAGQTLGKGAATVAVIGAGIGGALYFSRKG